MNRTQEEATIMSMADIKAIHRPQPSGSARWLALFILCAGFLMIVVDATIVNVALPSIQQDLGFSQAGLAWVVNAYMIAFAGLLLLSGRLGDLIGRKRIFIVGLGVFISASILCGLSVNQPMLIAARFVQGIGGALSSAVILGMIVTMFTEAGERARAMGIFAFVASAGASIGLLAGGLITQAISWHWIFFVNLPIGVATALLAARFVEPDLALGLGEGADWLGAFLVTAALMIGVYGIVESNTYGLGSIQTIGFGGVAIVLLVVFLARQARIRNPILPLRLFRSRTLSVSNAIQGLMVVGMFGVFFLGSLDFVRVLHYGPLAIGLAFLPVAVTMGALSADGTARLIMRFGSQRVLVAGQVLIALALLLLAGGPVHSDYVRDLLLPMILMGVGGGLSFPALAMLAMADATPADSGAASGVLNTTAQVGGALGIAVLATVSSTRTTGLLAAGVSAAPALSAGYHLAWAIGACLVLVSLLLAVTLLRPVRAVVVEQPIEEVEVSA
ncbi:MAG TPA: MFS transporter [Candidatus Angelobacter sp.]|jgi:EmrB/QacA subfamily drug resistance transporter|nr:MFS transporter [Candidatus Angelobacter sp.]